MLSIIDKQKIFEILGVPATAKNSDPIFSFSQLEKTYYVFHPDIQRQERVLEDMIEGVKNVDDFCKILQYIHEHPDKKEHYIFLLLQKVSQFKSLSMEDREQMYYEIENDQIREYVLATLPRILSTESWTKVREMAVTSNDEKVMKHSLEEILKEEDLGMIIDIYLRPQTSLDPELQKTLLSMLG